MDERKKAYELLGLPEGASKEEAETKYSLLIRRDRASRQREDSKQSDEQRLYLEEINKAYKTILEYEEKKTVEQYNASAYGRYKGMAGSAEKIDHFFSYYKFHLLGVIALILVVIYGTKGYIDHRNHAAALAKLPPIDVSVSFYGEYLTKDGSHILSDLSPLEADILSDFPQWKRVKAFYTYLHKDMDKQEDLGFLEKSSIDLTMNQPDVYILDKTNFTRLAAVGAFLPLDGANAAKLGPGLKPELELKAKMLVDDENAPEEHVYGIDISASPLFKGLPLVGKEYIAAIGAFPDRPDHAFEFIKKFAE
ncbi:J domain-containing protein [Paenibacillus rhizovicinus]|uniref:J domain-containing protein n=1 Tax=Paenibacillus rhizovicinus TaxID=2704463 RepID=A0A6C0P4Z9_9BACL|nr:J domain-containing protein [Paenibacillus rhizovicinus]QHW32903.1 J domain-containing protein [Paenibacillus rhizovicinus]